jgi:hypothetical protein
VAVDYSSRDAIVAARRLGLFTGLRARAGHRLAEAQGGGCRTWI